MNKLALVYRVPTPRSIYGLFKNELKDCNSVLDIGCGEESLLFQLGMNRVKVTGLDIWLPYAIKNNSDKRYVKYIAENVFDAEFEPRSYDMVLMTDFLEHLDKEKVYERKLIDKICFWAKKKVVMMLPVGYIENDPYDGNPFLIHKSAWSVKEVAALGFNVTELIRVRRKKYLGITMLEFFRTMFAVKNIK